jgi:16S rRNA (guanine527-N7)-methyltransferase
MNRETLAELAVADLRVLEISVDRGALDECCDYLLRVLRANESVNLTAIRDPGAALRLHLVDSLAVLPEVRSAPDGPLCDIGSGGGFPGVPLCLATGRRGIVLDSARRKMDAVSAVLDAMQVSAVTTVHGRAEEYALERPYSFAVVTSRAVADLPILVEYAAPLLSQDGAFVALKGTPSKDEFERGLRAAALCGIELKSVRDYVLPRGGEARQALLFARTGNPAIRLPRTVGRAAKRPLA